MFDYSWKIQNEYPAKGISKNNKKVFGTFVCGGGSTMGYKLAGFEHLGGVEIDPRIAEVYKLNHKPNHLFIEDIRDFASRQKYPEDLYNLDILDGSPPCSSFSIAGNREKDWGKTKAFKEGQAEQRLDDLFFDYIKLAKKLQPKIVLAENVKGLIQGNAKSYVHKIKKEFQLAGYKVQLFLLNAATMGVPQKRERIFFICQRHDLNLPKLNLKFDCPAIPFSEISEIDSTVNLTKKYSEYWDQAKQGESVGKFKAIKKLKLNSVSYTIHTGDIYHPTQKRTLTKTEYCKIGSYPLDYCFKNIDPKYLIGMSVPPVMTAQIANQINIQWLKKI